MRRMPAMLLVLPLLLSGSLASATIVNIDVEGYRTSGGGIDGNIPPTTYVGTGAAGGGTVFNSVLATALSDASGSTSTGDNQTIGGTSLLDSTGGATSVNFSIGPIGLDNENPNVGATTNPNSLFDDYVFTHGSPGNTGGNDPGNSFFTISGLTPGATYDVYLYAGFASTGFLNTTTITGGATTSMATVGIFNGGNTAHWVVAADGTGNIAGVLGAGTQILAGVTVASVPEPASLVLFGLGAIGLFAVARRRRSA